MLLGGTGNMRILIVDDHEIVRRGISSLFASEPGLTVCGEAADGLEAVEKTRLLRPDVVIMDISMPNMNGLDATREIKDICPQTHVIVVSQHETTEMMRQALQTGASAYVMKSSISKDLLPAVNRANTHNLAVRGSKTANAGEDDSIRQEILRRDGAFENAFRKSENRFRAAMNSMSEGLYTIDLQGRLTYINPAAEAMFGWTTGLLGQRMHDVMHYKHPDGSPFLEADCPLSQVLKTGAELWEREDIFLRKDGNFFPVLFNASPLKEDGQIVGVTICFREDRNRGSAAEDSSRHSERIYRAIGESLDYGIWICNASGRNIYASPSFLQMVGLTQEQCSEFGWTGVLHPEDSEATIAAWQECIQKGAFWEREHRFRGVDGNWHYVLARGGPIRDDNGNILCWAGINLDIQSRKEGEHQLRLLVETLEARIAERTQELQSANDKLHDLSGKLLRTQDEERRRIARELHDGVGQLLAALSMNLSTLDSEKIHLSPDARRSLEESSTIINQASKEIRTMSYLLHPPMLDEVGLESALRWYIDGFAERSKIAVHLQLSAGFSQNLPRDMALALFRIVQECLTNVHRHSKSPTATVEIYRLSDRITLEVQDQGKGIPSDIQSKISSGEGFGVGLRGMRERIRQFGGRMDISSAHDGTRLRVELPISNLGDTGGQLDTEFPDGDEIVMPTDGESIRTVATILCIDDEAVGLLPRKLLLESAGHRVIEARSGPEGIQLFQSHKVDAVILDYWMSGMKGTTVAAELKRINPAVPIIVLSGMSDLPGEAAGLIDQWLVKGSHKPEQLLDSISSLLERRPV
jgi:PAS domain S-box-containing protein